jgi:DNA-binding transcriptional LysR family regulator
VSDAIDLPTNVLRTFATIVERGGFTQAAETLGLTQPTVSQQLKKLESLVGQPLLDRRQRRLQLTGAGQTLLDYAHRILMLNDEAMTSLTHPSVSGKLRLGIPHEFTLSVLPKLVGAFAQIHPDVVIEVECELSKTLWENVYRYDVVMAFHKRNHTAGGFRIRNEPLAWVSSLDYRFDDATELKIVAAPDPCIYRDTLQRALQGFQPGWSLRLTSTSYGAVCAAVSTGMGIAVLARSVVPVELKVLNAGDLPVLPPLDLRLHYDRNSATHATRTFVDFVREKLKDT